MYIRRKVFSVAVDESGEERYFSTNEIINEEDYLDEVMYSKHVHETETKKDKKMDRLNLAAAKMNLKGDRRDLATIWDNESSKEEKKKATRSLARRSGLISAGGGAAAGAILTGMLGGSRAGMAKNAAALGLATGLGGYTGTRAGVATHNLIKKHSKKYRDKSQKSADLYRRSLGEMSDEDYINKYGKLKKKD